MYRLSILAALAIAVSAMPAQAAPITGKYLEVRNCDVWTGPCFANAETNLTGQNAAMVWQITEGKLDEVGLNGLTVIAVIQASNTLGTKQSGPAKAVIIVDSRATSAQRAALVKLAQTQGGDLVKNVVGVHDAKIKVTMCDCAGEGCAEVDAGVVKIKTRCLDDKHDKHCGNETAYYPPLAEGVKCIPAAAEHSFAGEGLATTWQEVDRRGAYVGTFATK